MPYAIQGIDLGEAYVQEKISSAAASKHIVRNKIKFSIELK